MWAATQSSNSDTLHFSLLDTGPEQYSCDACIYRYFSTDTTSIEPVASQGFPLAAGEPPNTTGTDPDSQRTHTLPIRTLEMPHIMGLVLVDALL